MYACHVDYQVYLNIPRLFAWNGVYKKIDDFS